ncbi:MAG: glycine zipper family protein [Mariprofundus sp.]|nr:glycine zipper family protein [Mariprofundus sp.]
MKHTISVMIILLLSGCATAYQERTAAQGAVIGATAGAVIGAQSGNVAKGAVIGGALGALAGAVLAEGRENRVYRSGPRYHRRACNKGAEYFGQANRARNMDQKIYLLRKGLRYCPNNPAAHNDLGVALVLNGDNTSARSHFRYALRLDPDYYPAQRNLDRLNRNQPRHYEGYQGNNRDGYENRGHERNYDDD